MMNQLEELEHLKQLTKIMQCEVNKGRKRCTLKSKREDAKRVKTETNYDNHDDTLTGTAGEDSEDHSESEDAVSALPTAEIVSKVNERNFQRKKRRRNDDIDQKLISFLHDAKNEEDDDDRAFVTSLLPSLKSFDEGQKLQFRAEVLRIMLEIKQIPPYRTRQATQRSVYTTAFAPSSTPSSSSTYTYRAHNQLTHSTTSNSPNDNVYNHDYGGVSSYSSYTQTPATSPLYMSPPEKQPTLTELKNIHFDGHYH
ncbi:hypothetical protein RN001_016123 [Aquatica leii]|uniref:BESS domain-containing protein n=1 Tax=Aquatica leii TaxID=1421715 RepID=A0AAN7PMV7_9COLE|nr:hypothetical protein RN001_016123 [Aquatica leii]